MKNRLYCQLFFALLISVSANLAAIAEEDSRHDQQILELTSEAKNIIKPLAADLKKTLKGGIKQSGPAGALNLCQLSAQGITKKHNNGQWTISRISAKARNPKNQATPQQRQILNKLENKKLASHSEIIGDNFYHYQTINTAKVCLACHGKNIENKLHKKIKQFYPSDLAINFKQGDMRGAFYLIKNLKQ